MTDVAAISPQDAQTLLIDLDKIDIPKDARHHSPDKLAALAESLRDGQEQEIGVMRNGERFELIYGNGRVLAMRILKAQNIRARVYEHLTEAEKLDMTFTENEEREDVNPIYQAYLLKRMILISGLNQNQFAKSKGKTRAWVSQYKSYLKLPETVIRMFTAVNINIPTLRAFQRLNDPELQILVANELKNGILKPEDLKKRCLGILNSGRDDTQKPKKDPFLEVWGKAKDQEWKDSGTPTATWSVRYTGNNHWCFDIETDPNTDAKASLARYLHWLADCLDPKGEAVATQQEVRKVLDEKPAGNLKDKSTLAKAKLPTTEAEITQIIALSQNGPAEFFRWVYGADSPTAKQYAKVTWRDMGLQQGGAETGVLTLLNNLAEDKCRAGLPVPDLFADVRNFVAETSPKSR